MGSLEGALLLCFAALTLSTVFVRGIVDEELQRRCQAQGTCAECIQESPECGWCSETNPTAGKRRCNAIDRDAPTDTCTTTVEDPASQLLNTVDVVLEGLTQVTPERATVSVRRGSPVNFEVKVQPANNFPIDLYLLMDLSTSMTDDLVNLKNLGTQLATRIEAISNNFTLGFGSFVDKKRASFINLDPRRLVDPCNDGCVAPYSFRHVVSLTKNGDLFSQRVDEQVISGNLDFPEGGFDGLLQAIVCTDVIGWRPVSRKILLYISDAGFHYAGDGLLGGVIKPNDGKCHMGSEESTLLTDGSIEYNFWELLDYPSIGQIAEKLDEFDIIPIFAVVEDFQFLYGLLQAELGNRAFLGELDRDSSNVVDLVENLYNQISTSVAFSPVNIPGVSITTTITSCPSARDGVCSNVMSGQTVTFSVSVDVTECTEELIAGPREIELRVVGFGSVTVELSAICECGCNAQNQQQPNSTECTGRGTLVCGVCECNRGYFGDRCQCDNTGTESGINFECPLGLDNMLECSGRGICTCGICECRTDTNGAERFYGPACECDNTVCARGTGNEICSGPTQGECTCEGCQCLPEPVTGQLYTRSDCSCTPNTQTCIDPANDTDICNGRGRCECGQCICDRDSPYFGDLCELCSGDEVCRLQTCIASGDNALCTSCVVERLEVLNIAGIDVELFTDEGLQEAIDNNTLPEGSMLTMVKYGTDTTGTDMIATVILLPAGFSTECSVSVNVSCPEFVIVNETLEIEYEIEDHLSVRCTQGLDCIYPYFVAINDMGEVLPIHVGYPPSCPVVEQRGGGSGFALALPPWAIALILIGILLLLGIFALILLKVLLVILDYIELKKFENELEKIKYTKNENPLYHSATTEHKNPLYGQ